MLKTIILESDDICAEILYKHHMTALINWRSVTTSARNGECQAIILSSRISIVTIAFSIINLVIGGITMVVTVTQLLKQHTILAKPEGNSDNEKAIKIFSSSLILKIKLVVLLCISITLAII